MTQKEKLILILDKFDKECDGFFEYDTEPLADELIRNDIVPVVRCKDCAKGKPDIILNERVFCWLFNRGMPLDGFCSRSERREDNDT